MSEIAPSTVAQASVSGAPLNYNLRARTAATAAFMEGETWPLSEKLNATFHRENDDSLINLHENEPSQLPLQSFPSIFP